MNCPECHADFSCEPRCKLTTLAPLRGEILTEETRAHAARFTVAVQSQHIRNAEALKLQFHGAMQELLNEKSKVIDFDLHMLNQLKHYAQFELKQFPEEKGKTHTLSWAVTQIEKYHELLREPF